MITSTLPTADRDYGTFLIHNDLLEPILSCFPQSIHTFAQINRAWNLRIVEWVSVCRLTEMRNSIDIIGEKCSALKPYLPKVFLAPKSLSHSRKWVTSAKKVVIMSLQHKASPSSLKEALTSLPTNLNIPYTKDILVCAWSTLEAKTIDDDLLKRLENVLDEMTKMAPGTIANEWCHTLALQNKNVAGLIISYFAKNGLYKEALSLLPQIPPKLTTSFLHDILKWTAKNHNFTTALSIILKYFSDENPMQIDLPRIQKLKALHELFRGAIRVEEYADAEMVITEVVSSSFDKNLDLFFNGGLNIAIQKNTMEGYYNLLLCHISKLSKYTALDILNSLSFQSALKRKETFFTTVLSHLQSISQDEESQEILTCLDPNSESLEELLEGPLHGSVRVLLEKLHAIHE